MNVAVGGRNLKIGIVISPPRQYFNESKFFLKHKHEHWDTIASDYSQLSDYRLGTGNYRLTRTCFLSLTDNSSIVNENAHCLCWNDAMFPEKMPRFSAPLFCGLPPESVIENILIPYHKPFDIYRQRDLVFHGWSKSRKHGDTPNRVADTPSVGSRLCVRSVRPSMLKDEQNCPDYDMRRFVRYRTKVRDMGLIHHVIVQETVTDPNSNACGLSGQLNRFEIQLCRKPKSSTGKRRACRVNGVSGRVNAEHQTTKTTRRRSVVTNVVGDEIKRRLRFGHVYRAYASLPNFDSTEDRWDKGYWKVEAKRMGNLPRWKSKYTTHVPMEFAGLPSLMRFDMEITRVDTESLASKFDAIAKTVKPYLAYNNRAVLSDSHRLCFNGEPVDPVIEDGGTQPSGNRYDPSARFCTLRLPVLLPPVLEDAGAETYRRSVLYDHAMHMVVAEEDTVWTGDVRYKPALSSNLDIAAWRETPLKEIKLKPGVYKWTPFRFGIDTDYSDVHHVQKFIGGCQECMVLFKECEYISTIVKNDHTPHFYLMNTTLTTRHKLNKQEVFESATDEYRYLTDFDRLIHIWASDTEEFFNSGVDMPFNWWNKIDKHLDPKILWWPTTRMRGPGTLEVNVLHRFEPEKMPSLTNIIELRHQLLGAATKLVVKNPVSFFNRRLISVEICSGGTKGGGYTLLDENSLEVVGAVLMDQRGDDRLVYECRHSCSSDNRTGDTCQSDSWTPDAEPAVGAHFVPYSYHWALYRYGELTKHLVSKHDSRKRKTSERWNSRTEECFAYGKATSYTPHDFNVTPRDVVNAEYPFHTTCKIADVRDEFFGPLRMYANMECDPYDRHWYGKVEGTPRSKLSDVIVK